MKNIIAFTILLIILLFTGCSGGGGGLIPNLDVGDISGPDTITGDSSDTFTIQATGDSGITYLWSVTPESHATWVSG